MRSKHSLTASGTGQVSVASDDRSLCGMSRKGPPDEGGPYEISAASVGSVARAAPRRPRTDIYRFQRSQATGSECATEL